MKKLTSFLTTFLVIVFAGLIALSLLKAEPAAAQTPGSSCRRSQVNQTACYNNRYIVRCQRVIVDHETEYLWVRTNTSCVPATATPRLSLTPTMRPTVTPVPSGNIPPGVRWFRSGIRTMRCATPDNVYRAEFNWDAQFLSLVNGIYRSKFITTMTYASHPNLNHVLEYGWARCACKEGSGMCSLRCSDNTQHCGICVPCLWHDGSGNISVNPQQCPRPEGGWYNTPLVATFNWSNTSKEDIVTQAQHNDCGSFQTDLFAGSYQTDMFGPTRVSVNGITMNCSLSRTSLVNWTLLLTDRDCTPPPTITPTRVPTITPTRPPTITPTHTPTPTPTITPTPPTKGKKLVGMQVKTFKNKPTRVNISLGIAPVVKPYISKLNLRRISPNAEATGTDYNRDTKQVIWDLAANTDYQYQFCVFMTSGVKYCDTFRAASPGSQTGVYEYLTFRTGSGEDKIYNLWINW